MTPLLRRTGSDQKAFERLYRRHVRDVYRYSLAVLGDPADAEDVTQTTFLNAYRAFARGERPQKPENWLIAIAHNVCRQRFRQAQRRPREVEYADELTPAADEPDGPTAEDLRRAFSHLPPNQRAALVMRELEGRSYADIAEVLGVSVSALETLLFRARRALREQLEEQLTCHEAERAISRQLDRRLAAAERGMLRAHLRACPECARLAQSQRAQRRVLRTLLAVPLPPGLTSFFAQPAAETAATTVAAATGTGIAVKAAAVVAGAAIVGGGTYEGAKVVAPLVRKTAPVQTAAAAKPKPRATQVTSAGAGAAAAPIPVAAAPPERADDRGRGGPDDRRRAGSDDGGEDRSDERGDESGPRGDEREEERDERTGRDLSADEDRGDREHGERDDRDDRERRQAEKRERQRGDLEERRTKAEAEEEKEKAERKRAKREGERRDSRDRDEDARRGGRGSGGKDERDAERGGREQRADEDPGRRDGEKTPDEQDGGGRGDESSGAVVEVDVSPVAVEEEVVHEEPPVERG